MSGIPVSAAARGRLRLLCRDLDSAADRISAAAASVPANLLADVQRKAERGAHRALERVIARIPAPPFWRQGRAVAWRYLQPFPAEGWPDPNPQPTIMMMAVLFGVDGRTRLCPEPFGLAVTRHAIGRMIDRSAGAADPVAAVLAAHDALASLQPVDGHRVLQLTDFALPAASGAFLARATSLHGAAAPVAVCRTWIGRDQLHAHQATHLQAWADYLQVAA